MLSKDTVKNIMSKMRISMVAIAAVCALSGCAPAFYLPLSSHTLDRGENEQVDVLWITDLHAHPGAIYRCEETPQGPVCQTAQVR